MTFKDRDCIHHMLVFAKECSEKADNSMVRDFFCEVYMLIENGYSRLETTKRKRRMTKFEMLAKLRRMARVIPCTPGVDDIVIRIPAEDDHYEEFLSWVNREER